MSESIVCPVCGMSTRTVRKYDNGTELVECINPMCDSNLPPVEVPLEGLTRGFLDIRLEEPLEDERALDLIAEYMSGQEWSADTLDEIAGVVRMTGREIANYEG